MSQQSMFHDEYIRFLNNISVIKMHCFKVNNRYPSTQSILSFVDRYEVDNRIELTTNEILEDIIIKKRLLN